MREYKFSRESAFISEREPIRYSSCHDGIVVYSGSLLGTGMNPGYVRGITVPFEINNTRVTELRGDYGSGEIGYIEASQLKRISVTIRIDGEKGRCSHPILCGGVQNTIESMEVTFCGEKMHIDSFEGCTYLKRVCFNGIVIDDPDWNCRVFKDGIFRNCTQLQTVKGEFRGYQISDTFDGCRSLIIAPDLRVQIIGENMFRNCVSLETMHFSDDVKYIGANAFTNCTSIKDLYIPDSVDGFGSYVFSNCKQLEKIHLPSQFEHISQGMFYECKELKRVFLPENLKTIGALAFYGCASMKSPWIPQTIREIGSKAFCGCTMMREIFIPESVTSIGTDAFADCPGLIIKGKKGSFVEKYASENGIQFTIVD
ncbi:MAG: leucine-rich repeat domain-containing protein [Lachnospiraceae bacterium]|nr:leucine-rich repeat domain-containing protein [Lachnospiraceae bacterium]